MSRKTSVAEGLGYFIASITVLVAIVATALINDPDTRDSQLVSICVSLWVQSVLMVVGLIKMKPLCWRVIKWLNIVKLLLFVFGSLFVNSDYDIEYTDLSTDPETIKNIAIVMGWTIFVACVAHHLEKFYTDLLLDGLKIVLIAGIVHEGPVSTPPAQRRLPAAAPTPPTSTVESEKPKGFPSLVK